MRSVIGLESLRGNEKPGLIVDEALHAAGAEAVRVQQNDSEDQRLAGQVFVSRNPRG